MHHTIIYSTIVVNDTLISAQVMVFDHMCGLVNKELKTFVALLLCIITVIVSMYLWCIPTLQASPGCMTDTIDIQGYL